jgi:hypothetical protein
MTGTTNIEDAAMRLMGLPLNAPVTHSKRYTELRRQQWGTAWPS